MRMGKKVESLNWARSVLSIIYRFFDPETRNRSIVQPLIATRRQTPLQLSKDIEKHFLSDGTASDQQNLAYNVKESADDAYSAPIKCEFNSKPTIDPFAIGSSQEGHDSRNICRQTDSLQW